MNNIIVRDRVWASKAAELMKIQQLRKQYEEMEKNLMEQLKILSEQTNSYYDGFKFTYYVRRGAVDYKAIPELKNVDLEQYRKEDTVCWKLEYSLIGDVYGN